VLRNLLHGDLSSANQHAVIGSSLKFAPARTCHIRPKIRLNRVIVVSRIKCVHSPSSLNDRALYLFIQCAVGTEPRLLTSYDTGWHMHSTFALDLCRLARIICDVVKL